MLCLTIPQPWLNPFIPDLTNRSISDCPIFQFFFHRSSMIWCWPGTSGPIECLPALLGRLGVLCLFSWLVIPSRVSLSALLEQRGIQMYCRKAAIACLISPADIIFQWDLIPISCKSEIIYDGNVPTASNWIGGRKTWSVWSVTIGKKWLASSGNLALICSLFNKERKKVSSDKAIDDHCWDKEGQINRWCRVSSSWLQNVHVQLS